MALADDSALDLCKLCSLILRSKFEFKGFTIFIGQLCFERGHLVSLLLIIVKCFVLIRLENIHLYDYIQSNQMINYTVCK